MSRNTHAPDGPGGRSQWGEARKDDIGTAISETSRVWFTLANGCLDEVFYPDPARACVRSMGLVIAGAGEFHDDADAEHTFRRPHDRAPLLEIATRHPAYELIKETIADPRSPVVLQRVMWRGAPGSRLHVLLEPHLDNAAGDNTARIVEHCGRTVLAAHRDGIAVALACTTPWQATSAGFAGVNDGRSQLHAHGQIVDHYTCAEHGNVVVTGAVDEPELVLALGFGRTIEDAARFAAGALTRGYERIREAFVSEWLAWHARLGVQSSRRLWVRGACVLKSLEAKHVDGGRVAALAKPWGPTRGPELSGAYHLVWTRDLVESMGALLAAGAHDEARAAVTFLQVTQQPDGHWPQNMRIDGSRVWTHEEKDESALPILLVDLLRREGGLDGRELEHAWPMVDRAAQHLVRTGPSTRLDRWEDASGYTPFTVATEIAALVAAGGLARELGDDATANRFLAIAHDWDESIDRWLSRRGGPLAEALGIAGYYVRARRPGEPLPDLELPHLPPTELSPDALAFVRFGLRDALDPRIVDTVRAIDAVLETRPGGQPAWRRYPGDRYGEHRDGSPYDGDGTGRSWPLLVGERAHYELAAGHRDRAEALLVVMQRFASPTGMLPEQVWDADDVVERGLRAGQPTHSAAPLGWSHAEYLKLCRSLDDGRVFDRPRRPPWRIASDLAHAPARSHV